MSDCFIAQVKVVTVIANGERYIYQSNAGDFGKSKVCVKGKLLGTNGLSLTHGPDRVFLRDRVKIEDVDLTEELIASLTR